MESVGSAPTTLQFRTMFLERVRANKLYIACELERDAFYRRHLPGSGAPYFLPSFHMSAEEQSEILDHVRRIRTEYLDPMWLFHQLARWELPDEQRWVSARAWIPERPALMGAEGAIFTGR